MRAIGQQVVDGMNRIKKDTARSIVENLVHVQPKDEGEATAGWGAIGLGAANLEPQGYIRGSHGSTAQENITIALERAEAMIAEAQPGQSIHITNTVEHVFYNNQGNSRQAPAGYVENEVTRAEFNLQKMRILTDRRA